MQGEFRNTPEEARKLWVESLRSGEFQQGKEQLRSGEGEDARYCCLGVACTLFERHEGVYAMNGGGEDWDDLGTLSDFSKVQRWLGLDDDQGRFVNASCDPDLLTELNDRGVSFAEIADVIESKPIGLFVEASNA